MKRTKIINWIIMAFMIIVSVAFTSFMPPAKQQFYEIKIYRIDGKAQESSMDGFLKDAYIPAVHRAGIPTVGVFKPVETDTAFGKLIYVFIPFNSLEQYEQLSEILGNDQVYIQAGKGFLDAPFNNPPFIRYESILSKAFLHMPQFRIPSFSTPVSERIYEYRSYESATEEKASKKIHMFNEGGEIGIFESIGANAVFYGKVISGSQMPRLIYMTTYANLKSREDCWAAFRIHPDWKRISSMDEYKNTTSRTNAYLLHPTSYSDF